MTRGLQPQQYTVQLTIQIFGVCKVLIFGRRLFLKTAWKPQVESDRKKALPKERQVLKGLWEFCCTQQWLIINQPLCCCIKTGRVNLAMQIRLENTANLVGQMHPIVMSQLIKLLIKNTPCGLVAWRTEQRRWPQFGGNQRAACKCDNDLEIDWKHWDCKDVGYDAHAHTKIHWNLQDEYLLD